MQTVNQEGSASEVVEDWTWDEAEEDSGNGDYDGTEVWCRRVLVQILLSSDSSCKVSYVEWTSTTTTKP